MSRHIVIAGAGLAGALLATFLGRRGLRVSLFDHRPDPRTSEHYAGRSINLALSTRGLTALAAIGLDERVIDDAVPMRGRMMHALDSSLTFQPYARDGRSILSISRGGLNRVLIDAAQATGNVTVEFGARVRDVDLDRPALIVESGGQRRDIAGDVVIGCDGAFSAVRGRMMQLDRFSYAQVYLEHGYKELHIDPADNGGFRMEPNALHIWPRHELMLIALPNDDGSFTCTLFLPFDGNDSFASIADADAAVEFFATHFPDALALMPNLREQWNTHPTSSLHHVSCWPWHHNRRVLLIGDAAHAIVPFYGQGMNAAFEDCLALDRLLEEHGVDAFEDVIPLFAAERKRHTDAIRDLAVENFVEMRSKVADVAFLQRKKLEATLGRAFPETYRSLYEMVSFSTVGYADARAIADEQNAVIDGAPENTLGLLTLALMRQLASG